MSSALSPGRFKLEDVERVVAEPLRFKAKLAIGENAYTSLRMVNRLRELWDVMGAAGTGAAIAKSSLIAGTFFAPSGLLGVLGIGTAATPIGWVAFAAIASGGACYGMYRMLGKGKDSRVIEIPKYLNTPLDALGMALFDLLAPMALRIAAVDGSVSEAERSCLKQHLVDDWGLDVSFVTRAISLIEPEAVTGSLEAMALEAAGFLHANPDCNHSAIAKEYVTFVRELLEADGALSAEEAAALMLLETTLSTAPPNSLAQQWAKAKFQAGVVSGQVKGALSDATDWTMEKIHTSVGTSVDAVQVLSQARRKAASIGRRFEDSVSRLTRSARERLGKRKDV